MMNAARQRQILAGQITAARKVFEAIPIDEAWSFQEIRAEIDRRALMPTISFNALQGSVRALQEAGVVKEPIVGRYCRMPVRSDPAPAVDTTPQPVIRAVKSLVAGEHLIQVASTAPTPPEEPMPATPLKPVPPAAAPAKADQRSPIDLLSPIAEKLREYIKRQQGVLQLMDGVAHDIENAAAELEERQSASAEEIANLRQLKALLKTLGG